MSSRSKRLVTFGARNTQEALPLSRTLSNNSHRSKMPSDSPKPDVIPLSQAINKYFDLSLYLLVLMGFGTLASTGGLDVFAITLAGSALAIRGYWLARRRRVVISARWTTPL